jgi:hypothetical protein
MDPDAVFERADVSRNPGDLLPRGSDEVRWVAVDPETGCRGVGRFEKAARTNLVYAVEEYRDHPGESVPYMSSGNGQTFEMGWQREDEAGLGDRLPSFLPF